MILVSVEAGSDFSETENYGTLGIPILEQTDQDLALIAVCALCRGAGASQSDSL